MLNRMMDLESCDPQPPDRHPQHAGHVDPRQQRGPRRAGHAEGREAAVAEDQHPVRERVHHVRAHQREHHRRHPVHALEIPPKGREEDQKGRAPDGDGKVGLHQRAHFLMKPHRRNRAQQQDANQQEGRRQQQCQGDAVAQPRTALVETPGAVRLRHQRVEAEQQAHAEHGVGEVNGVADAHRADRGGPERAHHDRVDHAHRHPAELGEDHGSRDPQHGFELVANQEGLTVVQAAKV